MPEVRPLHRARKSHLIPYYQSAQDLLEIFEATLSQVPALEEDDFSQAPRAHWEC